jgi:hypothetical protein
LFVLLKKLFVLAACSGLSHLAFLSHRRWVWLDIVLYWRQKFRSAASWENDGIGKAGNIVKQADELPGVGCAWSLCWLSFIGFMFNTV